jgi:hypothetical protein
MGIIIGNPNIILNKYMKFILFIYVISLMVVCGNNFTIPLIVGALLFIVYQIIDNNKISEPFQYLDNPVISYDNMEQKNINFDKITPTQLNDNMIKQGNELLNIVSSYDNNELDDREKVIMEEIKLKALTLIQSANNQKDNKPYDNNNVQNYLYP